MNCYLLEQLFCADSVLRFDSLNNNVSSYIIFIKWYANASATLTDSFTVVSMSNSNLIQFPSLLITFLLLFSKETTTNPSLAVLQSTNKNPSKGSFNTGSVGMFHS